MITQDYSSHGLQLEITDDNSSCYIEIIVKNQNFSAKKRSFKSKFLIAFLIYIIYVTTISQQRLIYHIVLITTCLLFFYQLISLVEKQSIKFIPNVGLEKSTTFIFNQNQRNFIPATNISGIVINEVIYFNRFIFVLQLLTAKELYHQKPVIVLFDELLPPLSCLEKIYKKIYKFTNS